MDRPRTPSVPSLVAGSLVAGTFVLLAALTASSSTTACSTAETAPAPDAAKPPCNPGPFIFCQPLTPGQSGCNTEVGSSAYLKRMPTGTTYPVGCVVNFVGPRDEQGDCRLDAVCKCEIGEIPGTGSPAPEAGPPVETGDAGDAGDDAEAGSPSPSPSPSPTPPEMGPVWHCSP